MNFIGDEWRNFPVDDASVDDVKNFHREILLMKSAGNHKNIVSLIGCCTSIENPLLIVEYCSKGDLQTYLKTVSVLISIRQITEEIFNF